MKGIIIGVNNTLTEREFESGGELDFLQGAVGGYIQIVPHNAPINLSVYCNEEGKITDPPLEPNMLATALFSGLLGPSDYLAGPVVLTGPIDDEGYTTGISDRQCEQLYDLVARIAHTYQVVPS